MTLPRYRPYRERDLRPYIIMVSAIVTAIGLVAFAVHETVANEKAIVDQLAKPIIKRDYLGWQCPSVIINDPVKHETTAIKRCVKE